MKSLSAQQQLIAPIKVDLPAKARPEQDWLYSTGGKPHEPTTDTLAAEVVALWRPELAIEPKAMRPGWAGLASYRLPLSDGDKHLKIAMGQPAENLEAYNKLCASTVGEAARASWAGNLGLGPKVLYVNAARGAFVADFVSGQAPTFEESQKSLLPLHVKALASIHSQDASTVPQGGEPNWLLGDWINVGAQLANNKTPRPAAFQHALVQMEKGLEFFINRQTGFRDVPIHDDYKPDNTIYDGHRMVVLDWNNLRVANPAIDLGHFACMVDLSAAGLEKSLIAPYEDAVKKFAPSYSSKAQLLNNAQAYTSFFRLRNTAFYDQWEGTRPKADYLRHQLIDDVEIMQDTVLAEVGMKADLKKE